MPKLLEQVRSVIRFRHYSHKTEETYVYWIKQYIFFNDVRHPAEMGKSEVADFLSHLARDLHVFGFYSESGTLGVALSIQGCAENTLRMAHGC